MLADFPRKDIDTLLFKAMAAIYHFERRKVQLFGINYEAFYLLYYLRRKKTARMKAIAEEMNIHLSTASRAVERLEKRRLVSRRPDPADRRRIIVSLEPAGAALVRASEDHSYQTILPNIASQSPADIAALVRTAGILEAVLKIPDLETDQKIVEKTRRKMS